MFEDIIKDKNNKKFRDHIKHVQDHSSHSGDITFFTQGQERVRFCQEGGFYVEKKLVTDDMAVYEAMKKWLADAGYHNGKTP